MEEGPLDEATTATDDHMQAATSAVPMPMPPLLSSPPADACADEADGAAVMPVMPVRFGRGMLDG